MKIVIFWNMTPCSLLGFALLSRLTMKMEATCSSETLIDFQRAERRYVPEDCHVYSTSEACSFQ
jgi:hypothetical protein